MFSKLFPLLLLLLSRIFIARVQKAERGSRNIYLAKISKTILERRKQLKWAKPLKFRKSSYTPKNFVFVCPLYQFSMQRNLQAIQQNRNLENVLVFGSTEVKRESFTQKILSRNSNAIEDLCSEYNFHLEIGLKSNCVSQGQARRRCDQETRMKRAQGKKYVFKVQQRTRIEKIQC